ncbi:hypothetical protein [Lactiplantibacillus fabifermentans]|uniref:Uncharacterized protein n=1 Tax=Lactiplantibacillus fabifermentans DSM 21115 TaxID=1413187 RepID=A0A0R2NP35_9LACO|nr:hypothetical protein [Lactiplantibacillus fabifermentans]KRO27148.1 hypothetical protein DY78_GL000305 [Lactiplantibacillus fabifermentans DSM 21115]
MPCKWRKFGCFCRTYGTDIFEDWRILPSFKVRFETAFWLEPVATATGIATDAQRQLRIYQYLKRPAKEQFI